jgi:hypothetical protein
MKRTVYGTWAQIKHVITQNNKLNKLQPGAGYDSYEVVPVTQPLLPPEPLENKHHRPYIYDANSYKYINFDAMFSPHCNAAKDAKRTNTPVEYFQITFHK